MALSDKTDVLITEYIRRQLPDLEESIKLYIQEELKSIEITTSSLATAAIQVTDKAPDKPVKGMVRYAVSPWDPLSNGFSGLVVYNGTAWAAV
tara:strand:+ start:430 stop:708 length:279 start_codon:yes stop_codon:yes gene_type:complete